MLVDQRWAEIEHGEGTCPCGTPKAETGYVEGRIADLELESQLSSGSSTSLSQRLANGLDIRVREVSSCGPPRPLLLRIL